MLHELTFLIGSFNCVTHASQRTWHFTSTNAAWNSWVNARTYFAPQNGQPADVASTYVGYDADAKAFNIVSLDADGSWFSRKSTSRALNGTRWNDIYPADGTRAHLTFPDGRHYVFETTDVKGGLSKTVCTRTP